MNKKDLTATDRSKLQLSFPRSELSVAPPTVILLGPPTRVSEVASEIDHLGFDIKKASYVKDMRNMLSDRVAAIVYVLPLKRSHVLSVHKNNLKSKRLQSKCYFAIAPGWVSDRTEREMYRAGIRMIFDWSKEKRTFQKLFTHALSAKLEKVGSKDVDVSLEKAIGNRLAATYAGFRPDIQISVYHGIAMLRGKVRSIQFRKDLVSTVKNVPGVRGVIEHSLEVKASGQDVGQMKAKANKLIAESYGIDHRTLEVDFDQNSRSLVLTGTAASEKTVRNTIFRLEKLYGVEKIINQVVLSEGGYKRDQILARRAQRAVNQAKAGAAQDLQVKVRSGRALIKGQVHDWGEAKHIWNLVKSIDGIKSVDNMLTIANAA